MASALIPALLIGGISAGASVYGSYQQAQAQNKYMEATYKSEVNVANAKNRMIVAQHSEEERRISTQAQLIRSRIRAAAGEAGIGLGGTYQNLIQQADFDAARNEQIANQNTQGQLLAVAAGVQPLPSQQYIPWLSGLAAGLQGFGTGLSIGGDINQTQRPTTPTGGLPLVRPSMSGGLE
jgi:hypothetical protein